MDLFGDGTRGGPPPARSTPHPSTPLTAERIRDLLARRREAFEEIRARVPAIERREEARELVARVWPGEWTGHPDAPDLFRLPVMLDRFRLAHLWDARDELPAMLGTREEWEVVRGMQDEVAAAIKECDAVPCARTAHVEARGGRGPSRRPGRPARDPRR
jgi:hypothetical protein